MIVYAVVSAAFGLGFVIAPEQLFPIYGVTPDAALKLIGQLFGAVLISLSLLTWFARNFSDSDARRVIVLALLVGETIGFILALIGQLNGVLNALGWFVVVTYLCLALGLAYLQFLKPGT